MTTPHDHLREDPTMADLIAEYGELQIDPADDFFQRFVTSILRQQVSMASAAATRERLFDAVEMTPEGLLDAEKETLRDAGLSRQKTDYVRNVAQAFVDGRISRDSLAPEPDDVVRQRLTAITGVGDWTANMQLLFTFGREDVFPVGDLGVRKGMEHLYGIDDRAAMVEYAELWAPYRSYATLYCWRVEEDIAASVGEVVVDP